MRKIIFAMLIIPLALLHANGVAVVNASNGVYLRLDSTTVNVSVIGQIAKTVTTQYFTNSGTDTQVKYGFPLSEQQSAIQLRWEVGTKWYNASIVGTPQDTSLPGGDGGISPNLATYLGKTPLYFSIPQTIKNDSMLVVELTYVELLPYSFNEVNYVYPSDYQLIQLTPINLQRFDFFLTSQRAIDSIKVTSSHAVSFQSNYGDSARISIELHELAGTQNYAIQYSLSAHQLGLFAYSTKLPDELIPDSLGNGFLTFIAEPDPSSTTATIPKVFTLIIDRSGSMYGSKMDQAKNAAKYIVQNLNEADKFNLIDFDDMITSFRPTHVSYTAQSRDSALAYIDGLYARNNTSISGAFDMAIPQFGNEEGNTANIIIFLTDGQPTADITDIPTLSQHIDTLIAMNNKSISVFCFGIGDDANKQLLTLISSHNKGLAEFLGDDELYSRITNFYLEVRNPVLLNSHISFTPSIVTEVFPDSLPNLYKGNQMIIAGRYKIAQPVKITLSGTAFGQPVSYDYDIQLADSSISNYQFLPKIWAKRKIESLFVRYYSLPDNSEAALSIKNQIVDLSKSYGIVTTFTSFSNIGTEVKYGISSSRNTPADFELLGNYPNPFNPSTTIKIRVNSNIQGDYEIRIYNIAGQIVRRLTLKIRGKGQYEIIWNGQDDKGNSLSSGIYFYGIDIMDKVLVGKMVLLK